MKRRISEKPSACLGKEKSSIFGKIDAFTIVELLAVVVIIGIVACVVVPGITDSIEKARLASDKALLSEINRCNEMLLIENGNIGSSFSIKENLTNYGINGYLESKGLCVYYDKAVGFARLMKIEGNCLYDIDGSITVRLGSSDYGGADFIREPEEIFENGYIIAGEERLMKAFENIRNGSNEPISSGYLEIDEKLEEYRRYAAAFKNGFLCFSDNSTNGENKLAIVVLGDDFGSSEEYSARGEEGVERMYIPDLMGNGESFYEDIVSPIEALTDIISDDPDVIERVVRDDKCCQISDGEYYYGYKLTIERNNKAYDVPNNEIYLVKGKTVNLKGLIFAKEDYEIVGYKVKAQGDPLVDVAVSESGSFVMPDYAVTVLVEVQAKGYKLFIREKLFSQKNNKYSELPLNTGSRYSVNGEAYSESGVYLSEGASLNVSEPIGGSTRYRFLYWENNGERVTDFGCVTMQGEDIILYAVYEELFEIGFEAIDAKIGEASSDKGLVGYNEEFTLTAVPKEGYSFKSFEVGGSFTDNPLVTSLALLNAEEADLLVKVVFEESVTIPSTGKYLVLFVNGNIHSVVEDTSGNVKFPDFVTVSNDDVYATFYVAAYENGVAKKYYGANAVADENELKYGVLFQPGSYDIKFFPNGRPSTSSCLYPNFNVYEKGANNHSFEINTKSVFILENKLSLNKGEGITAVYDEERSISFVRIEKTDVLYIDTTDYGSLMDLKLHSSGNTITVSFNSDRGIISENRRLSVIEY